jgi:eukaryotic-like serine/threonine-protein kinase
VSRPGEHPQTPRVLLNGRYQLAYKLGDGGMGSVHLAHDTLLDRSVALKELISRGGATDLGDRRMRAVQEARAMARVRHPTIVPIHDVFFIDDDPWIVMEYINGRSLHDIIKEEETLDERFIARIGLQVLRGLMAVHRAGVVHRDVKPANILVADESVFLVDFGIARIAGDPTLTRQSIVGTPDFLAPERFKPGYKVGPPADIWALGVTLYYALEGYSPFWRDSERSWEATMIAIINENPQPPTRNGRLADISLRMLHKDPNRRADAGQVLTVLEQIVVGQAVTPPPPPRLQAAEPEPAGRPATDRRGAAEVGSYLPFRQDGQPPRPPAEPPQRPGEEAAAPRRAARAPRYDDARELLKNMGTDTGVAMLLALPEDEAVQLLADCTPRLCGELLQGIAAARPATAAGMLRRLRAAAAGRAFAYLRPETAASLVSTMIGADALRILDSSDERAVADMVMELPSPAAADLLKAMYSRQRAAQVLTHVRPATAGELLSADPEFATAVLRHLSEPVRKQVSRHLAPRGRAD